MTRFTFSYARRASKYAAVVLGLWAGFGFMGTANAVQTGMVQVTCSNGTFNVGWDNSNDYFADKGNIAAFYCQIIHNTGYVSDSLSDPSLRYYLGVIPVDTPTATDETHTVVVQETETPSTSVESPTVDSPNQSSDSSSVVVETSTQTSPSVDSSTTSTVTDSVTVVVDTSTPISDTATAPVDTSTVQLPEPQPAPLPTPIPVVEPQPVPAPEPPAPVPPAPQPEPQPQPEPAPEPEPIPEEPPIEEPAPSPEPAPPAPEEQPPAEQPSEPPVVEDTSETPLPPAPEAPTAPTPAPLPQPVAEPEPTSQPEIAYEPPTVTLDNGVILTQEEAVAVALLQNPGELLSELFTDPGAVFDALGSVGADMSPEVREKSEKVLVSAVIVGNIATQAAAVAGAATYRRKP